MATNLSKEHWIQILQNEELTKPHNLRLFQALYSRPDQRAFSWELGELLGHKKSSNGAGVIAQFKPYAERISKKYDIDLTIRKNQQYKYWDLFFNGEYVGDKPRFIYSLKPEMREAMEEINLTGDELFPEEIPNHQLTTYIEGAKKTIVVNAYERSTGAKEECKKLNGHDCIVCGFNFEKTFGELGKHFIHVHHLVPLHQIGESYKINPITDLVPICPNCHAMIHRKKEMLSIKQLKEIIFQNKKNIKGEGGIE
jgi:5-methylcytosine-specific restriction protein A